MKEKEKHMDVVVEEFQKELSNVLRSDDSFKEKLELLLGIWEKSKFIEDDIDSPF